MLFNYDKTSYDLISRHELYWLEKPGQEETRDDEERKRNDNHRRGNARNTAKEAPFCPNQGGGISTGGFSL